MKDADRKLATLAGMQRQVFTRTQAVAAGLTNSDIHYRVSHGLFVPRGPHTLHFAGTVLDWRGELMAGLLDLGASALVSARSAAALHHLDGYDEVHLDFLVPRAQRGRTTIGLVASTPSIEPLDRVAVDGMPVTSGTFTVLQLLDLVTARELGNAIDSAARRGITAPTVLRRRLVRLGRRGRAGVRVFDEVMESAGVQSWLERQFLKLILRAGFPKPAIQRIYREDGTHIARVDFDFDPAPVIVEVGGKRGYMSSADRLRQEHRRNELQLIGKVVYFFTTEDVSENVPYVLDTLRRGLGLAS